LLVQSIQTGAIRHGGDFPPHRDAGIFQPRRRGGRMARSRLRAQQGECMRRVGVLMNTAATIP
jgi:hypothetical protein